MSRNRAKALSTVGSPPGADETGEKGDKMEDKIIEILMRRDGVDIEEAKATLYEALDGVNWYIEEGEFEEAEIWWEQVTGLECDYLMGVLI